MKNWTIGARLGLGFGLLLATLSFITVMAVFRLHTVASATRDMLDRDLATERLAADWYRIIFAGVRRTTAIARSNDPALGAYFSAETAANSKEVEGIVKKLEPMLETAREKALLATMAGERKKYIEARDTVMRLKAAGKAEEADAVFEKDFNAAARGYLKTLEDLLEIQRRGLEASAEGIEDTYQTSRTRLLAIGLAALLGGAAFAWWLARGITRPLQRAVQVARKVADADLTSRIEVESRDETGQLMAALRDMNESLARLAGNVRETADSIAAASSQIAGGNIDLSARTEQQAASLEETAASMEELTSTVKQNADNARQANTLAVAAAEVAQRGGGVVGQVVETMASIDASSRRIVDIIAVIDGIAFQTNILALNAAVEAARAGEQGRGFAVVATEVRSLARRSADAAKEIKALIDTSVGTVAQGTQLVRDAGATMDDVVLSVRRVTDIMAEIAAASGEQSAGIEQVNRAMAQMDEVTQQNAALVEEAAAAAAALQDQAAGLATAVSVFRLEEGAQVIELAGHAPRAGQPAHPAPALGLRRRA